MSVVESFTAHNLNPHYFTENRCEFRLSDTFGELLRTDLRIEGIELNASAQARFPFNMGALALVKNARLLNDNVEISAIVNGANKILGQKQLLFSNDDMNGKKLPIEGFGMGLQYDLQEGKNLKTQDSDAYTFIDTAGTNNNSYTINLNTLFPILDQLPVLDMKVFNKLRIVIEWENNCFVANASTKTFNGEPFLRFYAYNQDVSKVQRSYKVDYVNYIQENIQVDSIADDTIQDQVFRTKIFDGKYINRLCIIAENQTKSQDNGNLGKFHSYYFPEGVYNLRLNGKELRPQGGLDSRMSMLAQAVDVLGDFQTTMGQVIEVQNNDNSNVSQDFASGLPDGSKTGYTAYLIGSKVNTMVLEFERASRTTGNNYVNDYDKMAFNLRLIGEQVKQLVVNGGSFVIMGN